MMDGWNTVDDMNVKFYQHHMIATILDDAGKHQVAMRLQQC